MVREESHLDDMRAAIRGDFERLAERRGSQELMREEVVDVPAETPEHDPAGRPEHAPQPEPEAAPDAHLEPHEARDTEREPLEERATGEQSAAEADSERPRKSWLTRVLGL